MVEIRFKIFLPRAAASLLAVTTARSASIGAVRLQVVRRGAAIRRASLRPWSTCHSFPQAAGFAGGWAAITVAPAKAGALTPSISVGANRFRVVHRLLDLTLRRNHAPCRLHHQARTRRPRLLRHLALVRGSCLAREAGVSQNAAGGSRATSTGRSRDRASGSERVKRPTNQSKC